MPDTTRTLPEVRRVVTTRKTGFLSLRYAPRPAAFFQNLSTIDTVEDDGMCTVSMIMDHYRDKWQERFQEQLLETAPWIVPAPQPPLNPPLMPAITPEEVEEFRRLLDRARTYDRTHGQPDCELDEKRQALKKIAGEMGVEIAFL